MQDEWLIFFIITAVAYALGKSRRDDPHMTEMMMLLQQEMVREDIRRGDSSGFLPIIFFIFILSIVATVIIGAS